MIQTPTLRDLRANDSYLFLMKELEKVDDKILEPLTGTDWPRDMPVITGGGITESIATIDVTYASTGMDDDNIFYDAANDIPVIQADMSKQVARTFSFAEYMAFNRMEKDKMAQVGRDPETFLNKGIRLHFDKVVDRNVYVGFRKVASTGLCNNLNIIRSAAVRNAANTSTRWRDKTADEILADIGAVRAAGYPEGVGRFRAVYSDLCAGKQSGYPAGEIPDYFSLQMVLEYRVGFLGPHGSIHEPGGQDLFQPDAASAPGGDGVYRYANQDSLLRAVFGSAVPLSDNRQIYGRHLKGVCFYADIIPCLRRVPRQIRRGGFYSDASQTAYFSGSS